MKNEKIIELARKVLAKNEYFKEMFNGWNETAKTLTHWGQAETPEEMIYFNGENVVLSNECRVKVSDPTYTCELESSLRKDFEEVGLGIECYDNGTFHIFEEV